MKAPKGKDILQGKKKEVVNKICVFKKDEVLSNL
jgi:hypothetical protein